MNKVILTGRLVSDPETRYSQGENATAVSKYKLAVDRRFHREGEPTADFISCIAFGKQREFAEKYLRKGMKIAVVGSIRTGSYTNRDGQKVYTTDVVVDEHEFCESKSSGTSAAEPQTAPPVSNDGFMNIPDDISEELPFV